MTRLLPSLGFSFRPTQNLSVDLAFTYVEGLARKGSNSYTDLVAAQTYQTTFDALGQDAANQVAKNLGGIEKTFNAKYDIKALIPAIGISYSFLSTTISVISLKERHRLLLLLFISITTISNFFLPQKVVKAKDIN